MIELFETVLFVIPLYDIDLFSGDIVVTVEDPKVAEQVFIRTVIGTPLVGRVANSPEVVRWQPWDR